MPDKEFLQFIVTLPYVLLLSLVGGLAGFIMRLNEQEKPESLFKVFSKLSGELFLSGFAGLLTFLLCREWEISANYTAVAVAISGHMGGNAINQIVKLYQNIMKKS